MPKPTRQSFLDVAYDLFSRHGFHAVGLDRILSEVGVTKTTFYNHFESKDDLILMVLRQRDEIERKVLREMIRTKGGRSAYDQLHALFDVLHEILTDDEFRGCLFITAAAEFPSPFEPAHQAAAEHKRAVHDMLHDLAVNAGAEDPRKLADQLTLLFEGAVVVRLVTNNRDAALLARQAAEMVLERFLPPVGATLPVISRRPAAGNRVRRANSA